MDDLACSRPYRRSSDRWRPNRWRPGRPLWAAVLAVGLAACSDDGLAPTQDDEAANGSTSGSPPMTGSVNTSATVTATASAGEDSGMADPSPGADTGGGSTGPESGAEDGTTGASETGEHGSDDGPFGESTGGVDEPSCVMTEDCVCDPGEVVCEVVPPECPPGTVPEVDPGAMCWTFACVPPDSCQSVPDCLSCGPDLACVVRSDLSGLSYACEPLPPACMGVPSCGCMPDACPPLYTCVGAPPKGGADLGCVCELC